MKTTTLHRTHQSDALGINATTMHQYYNTVQSDVHPEHLVDVAMSRRQAMALQAHRREGRPGWVAVLTLVLLAVCAAWLIS